MRRALTEERLAERRRIDTERRRQRQLAAITQLEHLTYYRYEEDNTKYDQQPTADRMTTPDTHDNPIEENPMPALHNRALALKLAVENYAFAGDSTGETYYLVDDDGTVNEDLTQGVLALADLFVEYLGADEPSTGAVPSGDTASQAPSAPADTATPAIEDVRRLLESNRAALGSSATDAALGQVDRLRDATRGRNRATVIDTAISFVSDTGRREFGGATADYLIAALRRIR